MSNSCFIESQRYFCPGMCLCSILLLRPPTQFCNPHFSISLCSTSEGGSASHQPAAQLKLANVRHAERTWVGGRKTEGKQSRERCCITIIPDSLSPKDCDISFLLLAACQHYKCHYMLLETNQSCRTLKKMLQYCWLFTGVCATQLAPDTAGKTGGSAFGFVQHPGGAFLTNSSSSNIPTPELALDGVPPCTDCRFFLRTLALIFLGFFGGLQPHSTAETVLLALSQSQKQ